MRAIAALAALVALSACAPTQGGSSRYSNELRALTDECQTRGGILVPRNTTPRADPRIDYACEIHGASRIP